MKRRMITILTAIIILAVPFIVSVAASAAGTFGLNSITVVDKSTDVLAETPTVSGNTVSSRIVFHTVNDYVKYNLVLRNTTGTSYKILDITDNNVNPLIGYTYDNHADEVVDAGGTLNLELTIAYISGHQDDTDRDQNNNVTFTISYLDLHTGNVDEDEIILVPNTGENTNAAASAKSVPGAAIVVAVFAGFVFVIAVLRKKKTTAVVSVVVVAATIATSILSIGVVAEDYADLIINMNSEIRLRDYFYGEIFWKNPMTNQDEHITSETFGADDYVADDMLYFGDIFDGMPVPDNYTVKAFKFTGTDTDVDFDAPILDDWSVTVLYDEKAFGISYDYYGGIVASPNPTSVKPSDASFTLNKPTKDTAYFKCWTGTDISGCEENVTVDPSQVYSNLTFTANYQHEIIVNDQNGTEIDRRIVDEGTVGAYPSFDFHTDMFTITGGSCTNGQQIITTNNSYEINNIISNAVCTITTVPITYDVELVVNHGSGSGTATVNKGTNATFENLVADDQYVFTPNVSCTNGQTASFSNGTVTVNNVTDNTTCTANAVLPSLHTITYMQEMTPQICANTTTPIGSLATAGNDDWDGSHHGDSNYIPRKALIDSRDNTKYLVAKLADGECWMTQNLALELSTSKALTSADTDLNTKDSWTPNRNTEPRIDIYRNPYGTQQQTGNMDLSFYHTNQNGDRVYYVAGYSKSTAPTDTTDEYLWQDPGVAYMFRAASTSDYAYDSGGYNVHLYNSICPKGWSLPEGEYVLGDNNTILSAAPKSFGALFDAYSPNKTQQEYVAFVNSGIFKVIYDGYYVPHDPWLNYDRIYATYWSNYMGDYRQLNNFNAVARVSRMNDGSVYPYSVTNGSISNTGTVRCVAR